MWPDSPFTRQVESSAFVFIGLFFFLILILSIIGLPGVYAILIGIVISVIVAILSAPYISLFEEKPG
jgi:hypothetical protein